MKKLVNLIFLFLFVVTISCKQDSNISNLDKPDLQVNQDNYSPDDPALGFRTEGGGQTSINFDESGNTLIPCGEITGNENFFRISYAVGDIISNPPFSLCFTEAELIEVLLCAGLDPLVVDGYINDLFYDDNTVTNILANEVGGYIAMCDDVLPLLPPDVITTCSNSHVYGYGPFEYVPPSTTTAPWIGPCPPGTINTYTMLLSIAENNCFVQFNGAGRITLLNECTSEILEISTSNNFTIENALGAAGFSVNEVNTILNTMALGQYSAREWWNMYQFNIVPYLPEVQAIPWPEKINCWRFVRLGWASIYEPDPLPLHRVITNISGYAELLCQPNP